MKTVELSNGAMARIITPFQATVEGRASLLTLHTTQTRDFLWAYAEYITTDNQVIGIDIGLHGVHNNMHACLELAYRIERLLNNRAIIRLSSVFRKATSGMTCCWSLYEVSPDFLWGEKIYGSHDV
jgi:hypothetical protein